MWIDDKINGYRIERKKEEKEYAGAQHQLFTLQVNPLDERGATDATWSMFRRHH